MNYIFTASYDLEIDVENNFHTFKVFLTSILKILGPPK